MGVRITGNVLADPGRPETCDGGLVAEVHGATRCTTTTTTPRRHVGAPGAGASHRPVNQGVRLVPWWRHVLGCGVSVPSTRGSGRFSVAAPSKRRSRTELRTGTFRGGGTFLGVGKGRNYGTGSSTVAAPLRSRPRSELRAAASRAAARSAVSGSRHQYGRARSKVEASSAASDQGPSFGTGHLPWWRNFRGKGLGQNFGRRVIRGRRHLPRKGATEGGGPIPRWRMVERHVKLRVPVGTNARGISGLGR